MSAGPLPQVYLIRHGETEWSLSGRHTGRTDVPLTAKGEEAAVTLAQRLRGVRFDHVLTSPLQRARRTCELAGLGANATADPHLMEWDYGNDEGRVSQDISRERPGWNVFRDGCPGGETPEQVSARVDSVISRLRACSGNVAVFAHGHLLRALAARWMDWPLSEGRHLLLHTASVSILGFEHHSIDEPVIVLWNACPHE